MAVSVAGGWVIMAVMVAVLGGVKGELVVAIGSPFCTYHSTFLTCDYKGKQETVVLGGVSVRKVYIHNTPDLVVLDDVCISLALFNVANVTFSTAATCTQQDQLSLKLVDSVVNLVPSYITHLEMKGSEAETVACHNELRQLTIANSNIGTLEVTQPIRSIHVKFDHSSITTLKSLRVEGGGKLLLFNVTINTAARNSVYLHDASGSIWNSNFNHAQEQAIVLGGKSTLVMNGIDGRITFAGPQDVPAVALDGSSTLQDGSATQDGRATPKDADKTSPSSPATDTKPPGIPTKKTTTTTFPKDSLACPPHPSVLLWVLPTVLAMVEAIIIIVNCTNWFPALRGRRARRGSEDGSGLVAVGKGWGSEGQVRGGAGGWGAGGQGGNNHSYPGWYYNTQQSNTIRQRMGDSAI